MNSRWLLVWLTVLLAGGCSTSRTQVEPPVSLPARFSEAGEAVLPEKWWESFHDPVLDSLVEQALTNNLTLLAVWDRLAQTEAVARKAGAPLWPSVDAAGRASRTIQDTETTSGGIVRSESNPFSTFSLGLVAEYEVDLWGRVRSNRDASVLDVSASREEVQAAAITLSAAVASTWYALVEENGQARLLRDQLETNEKVLELITLRFRSGQSEAADVLQQRQLVESRRGDLASVQSRMAVRSHQLAILLGQHPTGLVVDEIAKLPALPVLPASGLPSDLVLRRPDIRAAHARLLAADRRVAVAAADRWPRISLSANITTTSDQWRDLFDNWFATMAANVVAPVFDAGERQAEVDRTRAVVSERVRDYGRAVLEALGEVEDALVRERKQQELIVSLEKQLALSGQVIGRIRDSYINGAVDYLRVLDVVLRHQALQRELLFARRELIGHRIDLCRALGTGWEMNRPGLATP
jgi:NodT family efflux transporter outer membrane factor (OMF) lipoprotein